MMMLGAKKNKSFFRLIGPFFYFGFGTLFGVTLSLTWIQQQQQQQQQPLDDISWAPEDSLPSSRKLLGTNSLTDEEEVAAEAIINNEFFVPTKKSDERDFFAIANATGTDKVSAVIGLEKCLKDDTVCNKPSCVNPRCRPWGHFYNTMYQSRLGYLSTDTTEDFQMLEIGFYRGMGFDAYSQFFPRAELHSMEISCLPPGPREEGKWPMPNFAIHNENYRNLRDTNRLHCGDASDPEFLLETYQKYMLRNNNGLPLKLVIDDGAHLSRHMVKSVFFWFPRIEPGGYMVVEDIQPMSESNKFRTQFLPQMMNDLHFCGDPKEVKEDPCFPVLQKLLFSIHCEMHICIFQRNDVPSMPNLSIEDSTPPSHALNLNGCKSLSQSFGMGL